MPFREIYFKRYPCSYKGQNNMVYEEIEIKYILVRKTIASAKMIKILNQFLKIRIKITKLLSWRRWKVTT